MGMQDKIVNLLSPVFENRVYPDIIPQAEIENNLSPCCVYTVISQDSNLSGCPDFIVKYTVQIDIYTPENTINKAKNREEYFNQVKNILLQNGFIFKQSRNSFDADLRLYRSSSDWAF
jgi:hypothetical protein